MTPNDPSPPVPGPAAAAPADPPRRAGRREWTAFVVLLLPLLLVNMDVTILYFAIPTISADLAPTSTQQLWILDIYAFVLAGLLITMGALGDRIGPRRLLLIGAAAFGTASAIAAYAPSPEALILARALLGLGGATLMPSTLSLVRRMFQDESQRSTAIAIWSGTLAGGAALGAVAGGLLLEFFWWGSVFLINLPAMALLLVVAPFLVPEFRRSGAPRLDALSVPLSMAAALPLVYGLKELAADGFAWSYLLSLLLGLVFAGLFVMRQRGCRNPMIDPALFRNRGFGPVIALNLLIMFAMLGSTFFVTQYLQSVLGMSPLTAALWSLAPSAAIMVAGPFVAVWAGRIGRRPVIVAGFGAAAVGYATLIGVGTDSLALLIAGAGVLGLGTVAVVSQVIDIALGIAPARQAGAVSALSETSTELGGALGMAVLGSVGAAVYRREVDGELPADLPPEAADAAGETLAGAVAVADGLPDGVADGVLSSAREAFTSGLNTAAVAGVVLLTAMVLFAARALRGVPAAERPAARDPRPPADPAPEPEREAHPAG